MRCPLVRTACTARVAQGSRVRRRVRMRAPLFQAQHDARCSSQVRFRGTAGAPREAFRESLGDRAPPRFELFCAFPGTRHSSAAQGSGRARGGCITHTSLTRVAVRPRITQPDQGSPGRSAWRNTVLVRHAAKRLAIVSRRSDAGTITPRRTVSLLTAQVGRKLTGVSAWTRSRKRSDRGGLAAPLVDGVAHAPRRDRASEPRRRAARVRLPAVLFTGRAKKARVPGSILRRRLTPS